MKERNLKKWLPRLIFVGSLLASCSAPALSKEENSPIAPPPTLTPIESPTPKPLSAGEIASLVDEILQFPTPSAEEQFKLWYKLWFDEIRKISMITEQVPIIEGDDETIRRICQIPSTEAIPKETTGNLEWPIDGFLTQGFSRWHTGIDVAADLGTAVLAADGGVVVGKFELERGYGNLLVLDHGLGRLTLYAHLSAFRVEVGQKINKGEVIGEVGSTGKSSGPHLHFEVIQTGDKCVYLNPFFLLPEVYK